MNFFFVTVSLLCSTVLLATYSRHYDPSKLSYRISTWTEKKGDYNGEKYVDFVYEGKVVFHVLERFIPLINEVCLAAENKDSFVKRTSKKTVFYNDPNKIIRKFKVGPVNPNASLKTMGEDIAMDMAADHLVLLKKELKDFWGRKKIDYFLKKNTSEKLHSIDQRLYEFISIKQEQARYEGKLIQFSHPKLICYMNGGKVILNEILALKDNPVAQATAVPLPVANAYQEK